MMTSAAHRLLGFYTARASLRSHLTICVAAVSAVAALAVPGLVRAQAPAAVVEMTDSLQFNPAAIEIEVGQTVEWRNVSRMTHTVTADPALAANPDFVSLPEGAEIFDSGSIVPGATFSHTFTVPGRYAYFCVPHQSLGMRATVTVVDSAPGGPTEPGLADPLPDPITTSSIAVTLAPVASGLVAPNWATSAPGQPGRLFVVDQTGQIYSVDLATGQMSLFLDVAARLVPLGASGPESFDERGLLGLAFHPDYQTNGLLYTYTSEPVAGPADFSTIPEGAVADHQSVILEWHVPVPADPSQTPDPASARELLRIDQPQFNHNAGALVFDADRLLLIALGDGGNADDQGIGHVEGGNAQSLANPLGSILRIDPLGTDSANGQYGIPGTNPFFGQDGIVQEIYAYGFRNPFRMSIDSLTSELWVGDAGQNDIEEIDIVQVGGNFGWNTKEGSFFFDPNGEEAGFVTAEPPAAPPAPPATPPPATPPAPAELIDPIAQYDHDEGIAVVGGHVYRGLQVPALTGLYVFGDYGSETGGRLFVLEADGVIRELAVEGGFTMRVLGFGRDADGELYVLANQTGIPFGATGVVLGIAASDVTQEVPVPGY